MSFVAPLFEFKNGKFSILNQKPHFLEKAEYLGDHGDTGDWPSLLCNAGLTIITQDSVSDPVASINIYVLVEEGKPDVFYAETWDQNQILWSAIFGAEDWPDFYTKYWLGGVKPEAQHLLRRRLELHSGVGCRPRVGFGS